MELQLAVSNRQLDITTKMSHWHLKFSTSKTNSSFPAVVDCQLALFLLLCPQLTKQHYHPPSCLHQKPWVTLDSSFPPISKSSPSASPINFSSNMCLKWVHCSPLSLASYISGCHSLTWPCAKALNLLPYSSPIIHLIPIHESELGKHKSAQTSCPTSVLPFEFLSHLEENANALSGLQGPFCSNLRSPSIWSKYVDSPFRKTCREGLTAASWTWEAPSLPVALASVGSGTWIACSSWVF